MGPPKSNRPLLILFSLKGTFDLELGTHVLSERLSVRQIPHLPSLTMCTWLRFLDFKTDFAWRMMEYEVKGTRSQRLVLYWVQGGQNRLELLIHQEYWTGQRWFPALDR